MSPQAISITDLRISRGLHFNLQLKSFEANQGSITCITGPNGSGKSTFIEAIVGLLQPDGGHILVSGQPIGTAMQTTKALIGYVPDDENWFIQELCAQEYFELLIDVYRKAGVKWDMKRECKKLAKALHFTGFTVPISQLSHGNKKKVQIIAAFMHRPRLIVVDELRNGLDPLAIVVAEGLLKDRASEGACIVATSHDLWWADRIADSVLLLINGKSVSHMFVGDIHRRFGSVEGMFMKHVRP